jgi:hypothetical protein
MRRVNVWLAVGGLVFSLNAAGARPEHTVIAHLRNSASLNWSGFAATGGGYTSVSAGWTQPSVSCTSTDAYSSFWVGIDGDGSSTVEQTGTAADCIGGGPRYYAWYEMFPKFPTNLGTSSYPVAPGDVMTASVTADGKGRFTLTISNATRGWTHTTTQMLKRARLYSAEVIAEAPSSSGGVLPLANFGTVNFTASMANGSTLGSFGPDAITMVTSGGIVKAQPSSLSGGTAFSVAWKHA